VARASHGRYLFPVLPLFALFFVAFLRGNTEARFPFGIIIVSAVFIGLGMCFEQSYVLLKIFFNLLIVAGVVTGAVLRRRKRLSVVVSLGTAALLGFMTLSVALASSMLLPGQIGNFFALGRNKECRKVLAEFPADERIWINNIGWSTLPKFYRLERSRVPEFRWPRWQLRPEVPKKGLLHWYDHAPRTYSCLWPPISVFRKKVRENDIGLVGLITSEIEGRSFGMRKHLADLMSAEWLELEKTVPLKNKTLHVFRVLPEPVSR
jgi:hypothetical protein